VKWLASIFQLVWQSGVTAKYYLLSPD